LNWISNYSIYQIFDVKLDALDGGVFATAAAAGSYRGQKK